jgi:broad specificity phosphatase PhoE
VVTTILVARHGETEWNREGRWQGWADPPLNELGRAQARELAGRLRATPFDAVYASDLRRAHETAVILAASHDLPVGIDADLREIDVGAWSGLTRPEIAERFPDGKRPDGETRDQHGVRVLAAVERIARAHPGERVLVVAHGGCVRALQRHLDDDVTRPIANCSVYELHFRDDGFLPV